jgi:hypothetical protein
MLSPCAVRRIVRDSKIDVKQKTSFVQIQDEFWKRFLSAGSLRYEKRPRKKPPTPPLDASPGSRAALDTPSTAFMSL